MRSCWLGRSGSVLHRALGDRPSRANHHARLRIEPLEDRRLLSVGAGPLLLSGGIECMTINSPPVAPVDTSGSIVSLSSGTAGTPVILSEVPTSTWTYGCTATAAGMLFGYYDRAGYPDMYTGPANGGLAPLSDLGQGADPDNPIAGACSIIATQQGFDGRIAPGHVDDYWISYLSEGPDPWEASGIEHVWGDCTADFLGTSQWQWDLDGDGLEDRNVDGSTTIYWNADGSPMFDFVPPAEYGLPQTEACHGLRLFAQSRGYLVRTNFTQKIDTFAEGGFTFADLQTEIDAGRPVMGLIVNEEVSHSVLIVGYNTDGSTLYIHDTWDNETHWMTWGGDYAEMTLQAVTVLHLEVTPTADAGGPYTVNEGATVTLSAKGSCDPTGSITSYAWDLDNDGQYDDGDTSTVTFSRQDDGVYTVRLFVIGTSGEMDMDTATVTVVNVPPSVTLGGPFTIDEGSGLTLTATATDPGNDPFSCFWDLDGGGQYDDGVGPTATFSKAADGTYTVSVKVAEDGAATDLVTANAGSNTVSVLRNLRDGQFAAQATYAVGASPHCVTPADVDGDGAMDLVTANYGDDTVSILRNLGDGTFASQVVYAVGRKPLSVAAADVDRDGGVDLLTADFGSGAVSVLWNLGDGTFAPAVAYAVGTNPFFVTAVDLFPGGTLEIVTADYGADTVTVVELFDDRAVGTTFTLEVGREPVSVAVVDVDANGALDLVTANRGSNDVSIVRNLDRGEFAPQVAYPVGVRPLAVTAADVNGDGAVDLATANSGSDTVSVLENQGYGTFADQDTYAVGKNPYSVAATDLDQDGTFDLVAANRGAGSVSVLRNRGGGSFVPVATLAVGGLPLSVVPVDVDGDGYSIATATITVENVAPTAYAGGPYSVDLGHAVRLSAAGTLDPGHDVVSYQWDLDGDGQFDDAEGQVAFYTPTVAGMFIVSVRVTDDDGASDDAEAQLTVYDPANPPTVIPGDADRNGTVNAADAAILMAHWGLSGMTWADGDFNGDGAVDADDATILTRNWSATTGAGASTATAAKILPSVVGPLRTAGSSAARRSIESAAARSPAGQAMPDSASSASPSRSSGLRGEETDAALAQEYGPQLAPSSLSPSTFSGLAWSRTLARRQSHPRDTRTFDPSALAVDLVLTDPGT